MNVLVEKSGETDGQERFILVDQDTGKVMTKRNVSEETMRKYLHDIGESDKLIDECFRKARSRYDKKSSDQGGDNENLDELFSDIGVEDDDFEID